MKEDIRYIISRAQIKIMMIINNSSENKDRYTEVVENCNSSI